MSKTLKEIIKAPSVVREQWLPSNLAVRQVLTFERSFGSKHLMLACHAALPLVLTQELLNLIHINILDKEQIPWFAEVDFLLSPLCRPIDDGVYEVEPSIREVLILELENNFGLQRPFLLAKFLQFYLAEKSDSKKSSKAADTQDFIAQAYSNADETIIKLTDLLQSSLSQKNEDKILSLSQKIQVAKMLEILKNALQHTKDWDKYQYLINNSRVVAKMLYGDEQALTQKIRQEQLEGKIDKNTLQLLSHNLLNTLGIDQEEDEVEIDTLKILFKKIESRFLAEPKEWDLDKLYEDLLSAKQRLSPGKEKELTEYEKQCLHVMLYLSNNEHNELGRLSEKEIEQIEEELNNPNLSLYPYIKEITKRWR
ncbi:hypothetical protein LC613_08335 [Nostoc sphaeroides CHAB 2801]|uniref:hypothetical protein n=1 Tax=Nostoc sphaeroides TaxID=446679 RepID=UPI000E4FC266|nr:hypothetical protein [Nostoc sphaeroides]MCC5628130.1 hypothetical protein [Nostoc sphaeroides CHAB 2801]